jgi:hypothetical protein
MTLVLLLRKLVRRFGREGGGATSEEEAGEQSSAYIRLCPAQACLSARLDGMGDAWLLKAVLTFCALYDPQCYRAITCDSFVRD